MVIKLRDKNDLVMVSTIHDESKNLVNGKRGFMVMLDYSSIISDIDMTVYFLHFMYFIRLKNYVKYLDILWT